jgi:threonine synthase
MNYFSTRGAGPVTLDEALVSGIARDGGLFLPEQLPEFTVGDFAAAGSIPEVAALLMLPFFSGSALRDDLKAILEETFGFPIPVTPLPVEQGSAGLLELYHGPTAAFKDVGAAFLAACLTRLEGDNTSPLTILVATSGDTGGAVAAAFNERPGMRVVVLFPDGRVSERQAHQLTCWGDNVLSLRVGRLLPQSTYYAHASLEHYAQTGRKPGFIVPTGNLGNALACIMAREMGLPIGPIILATNANRTISDYFETLKWLPRPSVQTLASAMDVGDPSNMERLRRLVGDAEVLRERLGVLAVTDDLIRAAIRRDFDEFGFATCPHTATATHTWRQLDDELKTGHDWILVATAHPAKFETIVEPLIGTTVPLPDGLAEILSRPSRSVVIDANLAALDSALREYFSA